jgi:hypothetical protein
MMETLIYHDNAELDYEKGRIEDGNPITFD